MIAERIMHHMYVRKNVCRRRMFLFFSGATYIYIYLPCYYVRIVVIVFVYQETRNRDQKEEIEFS